MHLLFVGQQGEDLSELGVQFVWCVTHDWQATALCRPLAAKRGHDDVATRLVRTQDLLDICLTVCLRRQKVEHGAIVPEVDAVGGEGRTGDVSLHPGHAIRSGSQAVPTFCQGGSRQVQHRQVGVAIVQQVIDQRGGSAADIDDGRASVEAACLGQPHGRIGVLLKPANAVRRFGGIDLFPVLFVLHAALLGVFNPDGCVFQVWLRFPWPPTLAGCRTIARFARFDIAGAMPSAVA